MQKHQPIFLPANYVRLAIGVGGMLILLALLFVFTPSNKVIANGTDMSNALTKYPFISGTRLQSCNLCHTSPPALNPYGSDYKNNGRNPAALGLIENLDSDGDGFTNLQEISNLFFPGDPNDHPPAVTPTPTQTNTPLPPTPTRTNTPPPPTPTRTNTALPPTPTRTNTAPPPTPTRTNTALPPTPTQTSTSLPPTPTSTNTPLPPTPTQTGTSVPPTPTGTGTSLPPTPTGTNTPLPPTATPTNLPPTPTATVLPPTPTQTNTPAPSPTEPSPTPTEPAPTPTQVSPGLDLEICSVSITPRVELGEDDPVIIKVQISKQSDGKERGIVKISGTRNGKVVYLNTQLVDLDVIGDCSWIVFPDYIPTRTRTIRWTLEVVDGNPDIDIRATTTRVYRSTRDGEEERERR